jgi:hypothetical protein
MTAAKQPPWRRATPRSHLGGRSWRPLPAGRALQPCARDSCNEASELCAWSSATQASAQCGRAVAQGCTPTQHLVARTSLLHRVHFLASATVRECGHGAARRAVGGTRAGTEHRSVWLSPLSGLLSMICARPHPPGERAAGAPTGVPFADPLAARRGAGHEFPPSPSKRRRSCTSTARRS